MREVASKIMQENPTPILVVAAALRNSSGSLCLQRRPEEKNHGGLWEFPGGKVEPGESPAAGLCRELAEELGILVHQADLAPCGFAAEPGIVILLYACSRWRGEPLALEGGAVGWFAPDQLTAQPMPPLDYPLARQVQGLVAAGLI